jgi:hypothetical protein
MDDPLNLVRGRSDTEGVAEEEVRRCTSALRVTGLIIRCVRREGHAGPHQGKLPEGSRFETVLWLGGDSRESDTGEEGTAPVNFVP